MQLDCIKKNLYKFEVVPIKDHIDINISEMNKMQPTILMSQK